MELIILALFCAAILVCVIADIPVQAALVIGFFLFAFYARKKDISRKRIWILAANGAKKAGNIAIIMMIVGALTATWRASGTIPTIVCYAIPLVKPSIVLFMCFLLNAAMSILTGTSFGTAATMGVITMSIATAMGLSPVISGGAIMSGVFVGDRWSPVSSSALLVSEVTESDFHVNLKNMVRTSVIPLVLTALIFLLIGLFGQKSGSADAGFVTEIFYKNYRISPILLIPALLILVLSALRVDVKKTMLISVVMAVLGCLFVQKMSIGEVVLTIVRGYRSSDPDMAVMIDGGGLISMISVAVTVCLTASYTLIFEETGLLIGIRDKIEYLSEKLTLFGSMIVSSTVIGMIACNQTLPVITISQLYKDLEPNPEKLANEIEDTAILISPLIPWSIAGAVPLATIGAPKVTLLFCVYLYLIPLAHLLLQKTALYRVSDR